VTYHVVRTYPSDRGVPEAVGVGDERLTPATIVGSLLVEDRSCSVNNVNVVSIADWLLPVEH
jgi:hypothetical protein